MEAPTTRERRLTLGHLLLATALVAVGFALLGVVAGGIASAAVLVIAGGKVVARIELKSAAPGLPSFFGQPRLDADGRLLLLWYNTSELFLVDAVANRPLHHHVQFLDNPDLSPDGRRIVGYFSEEIGVFDAASGKPLSRLPIGRQAIQSLHVLPDGRHVFTAGNGGHACPWDLGAALPAEGGPE